MAILWIKGGNYLQHNDLIVYGWWVKDKMPQENFARRPDIDEPTVSSTDVTGQVISISEHRNVEPLSKFSDRQSYNGRTRLIRNLIRDISQETDPAEIKRLKRERSFLERMQYDSRVLKTNQRPRRGRY